MAKSSCVAQWPRAEAVASIDRSAVVQQFGHQIEAIFVGGRKQRQRHFDRADLRLDRFETKADLAAHLRFRSQSRGCAQRGDDATERSELTIQAISPGGSSFQSGTASAQFQ